MCTITITVAVAHSSCAESQEYSCLVLRSCSWPAHLPWLSRAGAGREAAAAAVEIGAAAAGTDSGGKPAAAQLMASVFLVESLKGVPGRKARTAIVHQCNQIYLTNKTLLACVC